MMEDSQTFYVRRQGRVEGPWPMAKLISEVKLRKLGRHHDVSADAVNWRRASDVEGLFVSTTIRKRVGRPAQGDSRVDAVEATDELELAHQAKSATSSAAMWHYSVHDQQFGPVGEDDLVRDIEMGRLPLDALVWREGYADWVMFEESPELMARLDNPWRNATSGATLSGATRFVEPVGNHKTSPFIGYGEHPGFWLRFAAYFIDAILVNIIVLPAFAIAIGLVLVASDERTNGAIGSIGFIVVVIIGLVVPWLYCALFESSSKQGTPGKLACGFVVTDINGNRISFGKATGRYFSMIMSALTLGVGYIMCAFTEKKQCLHDMMAGCLMYKKNG
jgi:uncharacterized RDD family membrane protein YckC